MPPIWNSPNGPACPSPLSTAICERPRWPQVLFWWKHELPSDWLLRPKSGCPALIERAGEPALIAGARMHKAKPYATSQAESWRQPGLAAPLSLFLQRQPGLLQRAPSAIERDRLRVAHLPQIIGH